MQRRLAILVTILAVAGVAPANAAAACPDEPISQAFATWGDDDYYSEVPGGLFEQSLSWDTVGSPTIVTDDDRQSLPRPGSSIRLAAGESITSPPLCLTKQHPHMRFLARSPDGKSKLAVEALWTDDKGKHKRDGLGDQDGKHFRGWVPSKPIKLEKVLPKDLDGVRDVRLRLLVKERTGSWLVDDVFVDPLKR